MRRLSLWMLVVLLSIGAARASDFDFYGRGPYRDGASRPDEYLGYRAGEMHTHHFRMQDEQLRKRNLSLTDSSNVSLLEAERFAAEAPVFVWLDLGNDGTETANIGRPSMIGDRGAV